ncbi:MAG TPA: hypothetical protein VE398_02830 [Acidobacteriota bacterium]|nr:hypothetical protein [Acidobacteriota bacterium]
MEFRFLELEHYNNNPHFHRFAKVLEGRKRECTVLLPPDTEPQQFFNAFLTHVQAAVEKRRFLPIARFCDGEYSFYSGRETTTCWGERASSLHLPGVEQLHMDALRMISEEGLLCPNLNLIYLKAQSGFLEYLARAAMPLRNYVPFYFVYALLVNPAFMTCLRGLHLVLISNFRNKHSANILATLREAGIADVTLCEIPSSGVAHGEFELKLSRRPDVALVGAGIGSPLVLARLKEHSCVAIDSGFVFHLWDGTFDRYERLFLNYE